MDGAIFLAWLSDINRLSAAPRGVAYLGRKKWQLGARRRSGRGICGTSAAAARRCRTGR